MDVASTAINAAVVAAVGLILGWLAKGQFQEIHRRFQEVDRRFDAIDRRFEGVDRRFESMQASLDAMRSDLTQVALAVGVRPRATNG